MGRALPQYQYIPSQGLCGLQKTSLTYQHLLPELPREAKVPKWLAQAPTKNQSIGS